MTAFVFGSPVRFVLGPDTLQPAPAALPYGVPLEGIISGHSMIAPDMAWVDVDGTTVVITQEDVIQ